MKSEARPDREWWTAKELADAALLDMPETTRNITAMATRLNWRAYPHLARRRQGKGGGWEYHWTVLPSRAQAQLLTHAAKVTVPVPTERPRDEAWEWFDRLPKKVKDKAAFRLEVIQTAEALELGGLTRDMAVRQAARLKGCSAKSIWNWRVMIEGVRIDDRLPYLAPRHRLVKRVSPRRQEPDPEFGALIKADWLRLSRPSLQACYDRAVRVAEAEGIETVPIHTIRRWLKRTVSKPTEILARYGVEKLKQMYPPQVRDKSALHALEGINGDYHKFDVFVRFPADGGLPEEVLRPQMVAFQDIFSGKILAWRVARSANSHAVQLCLGDLIGTWGVPKHVLLDNGREFAAKAITGGTPTRYRFKVKDDDIPGLLTSLGCEIHWATPYSGQSKPIERAFRDLCDRVAKHPAFEGAYTGNRPDAKPENYGERAVDLDAFLEVLNQELILHNARPDRRSQVAYGRSFDEVFEESYKRSPIRKATEAQRRLWLMGAHGVHIHATNGRITFMGNGYWDDWMHEHRGEKVVARFDTANLWDGLHLYSLADEYLGFAPCQEAVGFFDVDEGRALSKARSAWMKAERAVLKAEKQLSAAELANRVGAAPVLEPETPDAEIVELVQPKKRRKAQTEPAPLSPDEQRHQDAIIADLDARRRGEVVETTAEPDDRELYAQARELERQQAAGEELSKEQARWLASFQRSAIYRTYRQMEEDFGLTGIEKPPAG